MRENNRIIRGKNSYDSARVNKLYSYVMSVDKKKIIQLENRNRALKKTITTEYFCRR